MSTFTKVKLSFETNRRKTFSSFLDEKKLQDTANQTTNENDEDLPRIDLNEMLADMTVEDNDEMDS